MIQRIRQISKYYSENCQIEKKCPLEKLSEFDDVSFFDASPSVSFQYNSE